MSQSTVEQLKNQVRSIVEDLRGDMSPQYFYGYVSGLMFYKHLSDHLEVLFTEILLENRYTINFNQMERWMADDKIQTFNLKEKAMENIGYYLQPFHLFSSVIKSSYSNHYISNSVHVAIRQIEYSSKSGFLKGSLSGVFNEVDLSWNRFRNKKLDEDGLTKEILKRISDLEWAFPQTLKSFTDQKHYLDGLLSFTESQIVDPADVDTPADSVFINGHEYVLKV